MTTFQLVTLPLLGLVVVITAVAVARKRLTARVGIAWIVFWLGAAAIIVVPDSTSRIAALLGIGRGADLVLYISILLLFFGLFLTYLRFRRIDEQLTKIVRHLAIRDAEREPRDDA